MSPKPNTLRAIDALSVVVLLAAAAVSLWPVTVNTTAAQTMATAPSVASLSGVADTSAALNTDAADVVRFNILSSSRRAPTSRYTSPEMMAQLPYTPPAAFARTPDSASMASDSTGKSDADAVPAVYGIVNMDGTWRALLRLATTDVSPEMLKAGDKRGTYRVVSIAADRVVVANSDGQRTLRLSRTVRGDSTKHKP